MTPTDRIREVITGTTQLSQQGKHAEALKALDEAIEEATRDNRPVLPSLCRHAAVISNFMGDHKREKSYYEQSLAVDPGDPIALYGLAKVAEAQGDSESAREFAASCFRAIAHSNDEIVKVGLLDLLLVQWPDAADQ